MFQNVSTPGLPVLNSIRIEQVIVFSEYLERDVIIDCYAPANMDAISQLSLLLINDGQDLVKMPFSAILNQLVANGAIEPLLCIGIHCGPDRKMEYGTACQPDYKGLGARAGLYHKFIFDELLPFLRRKYQRPSFKDKSFAGFSLGGLSAMDIVWNHATQFTRVGVFSGSLWWRRKGYEDGYDDERDRIMQLQVQKGHFHPWMRFFFQAGRLDEKADRNNNGVIDSIDDVLDMIVALKTKGFTDDHIKYLELPEGKHDVPTWAEAFPAFLIWGWGIKNS